MTTIPPSDPIIQLRNVTKYYGSYPALRGVSVEIPPGVTGLLGPNGAGKSTMIKLLLGLARVSSGDGTVLGFSLGRARYELLERVGYLPEDDCYLPGLTGIESVHFAARLCRLPRKESLRRSHELLDFCGMGQERYRPVETFSTGMRQKLKFATALVHDPDLLILDEPTTGLDPDERTAMLRRIRRLADSSGKSVLLCTHILPDVETVSDFVVILAQGTVRLAESHQELRKPVSPQIVVQVAGDTARFEQYVVTQGITVQANGDRLTLYGDVPSLLENVWLWANQCNVGLARVIPAQNSLQHVFIDVVKEEIHATV